MSVLILKKGRDSRHVYYRVHRQDMTLFARGNRNTVSAGAWTFYSAHFPCIYFGERSMALRGTDTSSDSRQLDCGMVSDSTVADFEQAVLALNKEHGNNKDLDISDVIWEEE